MRILPLLLAGTVMTGCAGWLDYEPEQELTVASVQQNIHVGVSGAEVIAALGSPNVITTDRYRNEVWIYDRFSTDRVQTEGPDSLAILQYLVDGESFLTSSRRTTESSTQRTLTVVIKFDRDGRVHDYAYHTSRF